MEWPTAKRSRQGFDAFVAIAAGPLFRTGYLMTSDVGETEDLLQETFIQVARRWSRVRSMQYPLAYARRILVNLVLDGAQARAAPLGGAATRRGCARDHRSRRDSSAFRHR